MGTHPGEAKRAERPHSTKADMKRCFALSAPNHRSPPAKLTPCSAQGEKKSAHHMLLASSCAQCTAERTARSHPRIARSASARDTRGVNVVNRRVAKNSSTLFQTPAAVARQTRHTERRRLHHVRPLDGNAEHVGLELHQPIVHRPRRRPRAAARTTAPLACCISASTSAVPARPSPRARPERGARASYPRVSPTIVPRASASQCSARSPCERRNEVHAIGGLDGTREHFGLLAIRINPSPSTQPLDWRHDGGAWRSPPR